MVGKYFQVSYISSSKDCLRRGIRRCLFFASFSTALHASSVKPGSIIISESLSSGFLSINFQRGAASAAGFCLGVGFSVNAAFVIGAAFVDSVALIEAQFISATLIIFRAGATGVVFSAIRRPCATLTVVGAALCAGSALVGGVDAALSLGPTLVGVGATLSVSTALSIGAAYIVIGATLFCSAGLYMGSWNNTGIIGSFITNACLVVCHTGFSVVASVSSGSFGSLDAFCRGNCGRNRRCSSCW